MNEPGCARTLGKHLLFAICALRSFMTSVSQDLGITTPPKDGAFHSTVPPSLQWGIRIDIKARVPPIGHDQTTLNPLGIPGRSPIHVLTRPDHA